MKNQPRDASSARLSEGRILAGVGFNGFYHGFILIVNIQSFAFFDSCL